MGLSGRFELATASKNPCQTPRTRCEIAVTLSWVGTDTASGGWRTPTGKGGRRSALAAALRTSGR